MAWLDHARALSASTAAPAHEQTARPARGRSPGSRASTVAMAWQA
jgi:hypothetical protein